VQEFELTRFDQEGLQGVLLNEALVFHFSDELDVSSVTLTSARILDSFGRSIPGVFDVRRDQLIFHPRLALGADLMDGGLRPNEKYSCVLSGFPLVSGLRARDGRILSGSFRADFSTVPAASGERAFFDETPGGSSLLSVLEPSFGGAEPIQLVSSEPLDPRTISDGDFILRHFRVGDSNLGDGEATLEEIDVHAVLVSNRRDGARIELRAVEGVGVGEASLLPRILEQGEYHLVVREPQKGSTHGGLMDLGGHAVRSAWALSQMPLPLEVVPFRGAGGNRFHRFEFLSQGLRSPAELPGRQGMALWDGRGFVSLRLPRAAGDGRAGDMHLGSDVTPVRAARGDLHASALTLEDSLTLDLSGLDGCVVVRSQGRMEIQGNLIRSVESAEGARAEGESWGQWFGRVSAEPSLTATETMSFLGGQSLNSWIDEARIKSHKWTILVAGSDLVIDGDITVDGPLLLAAGGRIRISGSIEAREIWVVGDGGGATLRPPAKSAQARGPGDPAMLHFAEPETNPLVGALQVGILSAPIRPSGKQIRWRAAAVGARPGSGAFRVRFLGERDIPGGGVETVGPVDDLSLLDRCDAVRLWIELEIGPGPTWDPPIVDFVEISWNEESGK